MKGKARTNVDQMPSQMHIHPRLKKIVAGKWKPSALEQEQMRVHLATCTYCQIYVEMVVNEMLALLEESDPAHEMLIRLRDVFHKRQEREQDIAAYAETAEVQGEEAAKSRFPALAEHLKHCQACSLEVKNLRKALREAAQDGLIAPLRAGVKGPA